MIIAEGEAEMEERYRRLVESCPDAIAVHCEGELIFVNPAGLRLIGAESTNDVLGRPILDFVHPKSHDQVLGRRERLQAGHPAPLVSHTFVRLDGSSVDVEAAAIPFTYLGRRAVQVVMRDLTERRRGERLRAALLQLSEAAAAARDVSAFLAVVHSTIAGLMDARNFEVALRDDVSGRLTFPYRVDETDAPAHEDAPGRTLASHVLRTGEALIASREVIAELVSRQELAAGVTPTAWLGVPLKDGPRAFGVLAVQCHDAAHRFSEADQEALTFVSQQVAGALTRRRAEDALLLSEKRYHTLAALSPVGIFQTDAAGDCQYVNERWCEIAGLDPAAAAGDEWARALHPDDRARVFEEWNAAADAGVPFRSEYRFRRPDGTVTWVLGHSTTHEDAEGRIIGHVGTITDITERKELEELLRQSQKIEAIGQLAGGVAHDFNNLLSVITGYGEQLVRGLASGSPLRHKADQVLKAAQCAAGLTQQLLAFSRRQVLAPKILDLNALVIDLEAMLRRLIREDIALATRLSPSVGMVKVDPTQIEQVILNLAVNARDAMPRGGTLTIETEDVCLDEAYVRGHPGAIAGSHVKLTVSDTGQGMDRATLARIFEPFFTTKGPGKGTGLGLATVYGIVKQSNGSIDVWSEPGEGTRFEIVLPHVEDIAAELAPAEAPPAPVLPSETILLVEDAESVREVSRELLVDAGYTVLAAADGEQALRMAREHEGPIQMLMTDLIMPHMNGRELAKQFSRLRPDAKILYVSGYTDDALIRHDVHEAQVAFLGKPFRFETLCRTIRSVLKGRPCSGLEI